MPIENLQTHPAVAVALAEQTLKLHALSALVSRDAIVAVAEQSLKLHAWVYEIESGEVFSYEDHSQQFLPLGEIRPPAQPLRRPPGQRPLGRRSVP